MAERASDNRDLLREHWQGRRDRIVGELRGFEAGLEVLPTTPDGDEVRAIFQGKANELRAELQRLNEYLGNATITASGRNR